MHRNFLRGLLIVLVPCVLLGACALFMPYRPGIDLAGGTILVYELDLEKAKASQKQSRDPNDPDAGDGLDSEQMQQLAEGLKKRIDPVDTKNVIIRPVGGSRVEIILPFVPKKGGDADSAITENFVQFVKDIVSQVGVLEFRILANEIDDADGIRDAEAKIASLTPEEADKLAKSGSEPPAPTGTYPVKANGDTEDVSYEWKELGPEERNSLNISNADESTNPATLYAKLAASRGKAVRHATSYTNKEGKPQSLSMLLYSREFKKENPATKEEGKKIEHYVLTRVSPLDRVKVGDNNTLRAEARNETGEWKVGFSFPTGGSRFTQMTDRNKPNGTTYRSMAILLDDKVVSAPSLNSRLDAGGEISGSFTKNSVDRLVYILKSGALTAQLKPNPVSENTVGPTLGSDTRTKGLWSIGLSFAAVLVFMIYYYRFAGLVACIALLINLLLTIGFMNAVNAAYTLAGLAGIVLMLGMAVDANVLIYERVREERAKGAGLAAAIRAGYDRALPTIIDTHMTSIFTAIVLYTFGNDNLKGFSVALAVGLVISLFTALYVTRLIFDFWMHKRWLTELKMKSLFSRPNIDFMAIRKQMFVLTGIFTVCGLGLFLLRGENSLNVDFRGGTAYGGRLSEPLGLSEFQDLLSEKNQAEKLQVKDVIRVKPQEGEGAGKVADDRTYRIQYEGADREVVVTLASDPGAPGAPEEEQLAALKSRASSLPDVSVEQVYITDLDGDLDRGTSKSFTLRTTEREPDLVQAMLDRLLRGPEGQSLIAATKMTIGEIKGPTVQLKFSEPTSLNYMIGLLKRQFRLEYHESRVGKSFELTGIAEGDDAAKKQQVSSGKYTTMLLDVSKNTEFLDLLKLEGDTTKMKAELDVLERILNSSKITFESRPTPERLETFDAALAEDTKARASYAILASWIAILLYLWFRFGSWQFGLAAVLCLVHDLCFTLGLIAACHYLHQIPGFASILQISDFKIDLSAVAALLTLVGYSVSDTIVVFDRIREVRGKNPLLTVKMINDSVNQTLSRTVLASLTVFLVVGVLYFFGGEGVHLFAFVMVIGVIVGTYSSIYIAAPLLLIFGEGQPKVDMKKKAELAKV